MHLGRGQLPSRIQRQSSLANMDTLSFIWLMMMTALLRWCRKSLFCVLFLVETLRSLDLIVVMHLPEFMPSLGLARG